MSLHNHHHHELFALLDGLCDQRLSAEQVSRLEELVLGNPAARRLYVDYLELHGALYWDTAASERSALPLFPTESANNGSAVPEPSPAHKLQPAGTRRWAVALLAAASCLVAGLWFNRGGDPAVPPPQIANHPAPDQPPASPEPAPVVPQPPAVHGGNAFPPPAIAQIPPRTAARAPEISHPVDSADPSPPLASAEAGSSRETIIAFIDERLQAGWDAAEVQPSPIAEETEWIRRVYLDVLGHIPAADAVSQFVINDDRQKRTQLLEALLEDTAYARNWTTIWANLLVGRSENPNVNRPALERFLRRSFARNRPWSEIVADLISAEGDYETVGETNFLLAHLNNQAAPATAITARLFLGIQVQCVQCHDHPSNDWVQSQFWELNSFFKQTAIETRQRLNPQRRLVEREVSLISKEIGGPTHFEDRRGLMHVAYPQFAGVRVDERPEINRRAELTRLLLADEDHQVARAIVNRMWAHFFRYGFTRPIDDMGPHNQPSHPELLDRLAKEFVLHGYDVKELIRWIIGSRAYQLASQATPANASDQPETGDAPQFSRMYVKPMTPEQVFDSLLIATRADYAAGSSWDAILAQRQEWLQQFVLAYETDENDEATSFDGTLPQAMMMMNGDLIDRALGLQPGTVLQTTLTRHTTDVDAIRHLFLAALSRHPTPAELTAYRNLLREHVRIAAATGGDPQRAVAEGLADVFWALLNSSEFVLVH